MAANLLESLATLEYPSWGYSLRPEVVEGSSGLRYERQNVWEIQRFDVKDYVRFYGSLEISYEGSNQIVKWVGGQTLKVMACDMAISGYNTFTTNCLRRWKCVDDP